MLSRIAANNRAFIIMVVGAVGSCSLSKWGVAETPKSLPSGSIMIKTVIRDLPIRGHSALMRLSLAL